MDEKYTIVNYLKSGITADEIEKIYSVMDYQLKKIHSKNRYIQKISFESIVYDSEEEYFVFDEPLIKKIQDESIASKIINKNIEDLAKTFIGMYTYISSSQNTKNINPEWFDFSIISEKNQTYVEDHYSYLKTTIPNISDTEEFFDDAIIGKKYQYYNDYKNNKIGLNGKNNVSSKQKVYSTQAGRAFTPNDDGFAKIIVYPIIVLCFALLLTIFFVLK